jgi:hypothetical protein
LRVQTARCFASVPERPDPRGDLQHLREAEARGRVRSARTALACRWAHQNTPRIWRHATPLVRVHGNHFPTDVCRLEALRRITSRSARQCDHCAFFSRRDGRRRTAGAFESTAEVRRSRSPTPDRTRQAWCRGRSRRSEGPVHTLPTPADFRSRALSRFHQKATVTRFTTSRPNYCFLRNGAARGALGASGLRGPRRGGPRAPRAVRRERSAVRSWRKTLRRRQPQ